MKSNNYSRTVLGVVFLLLFFSLNQCWGQHIDTMISKDYCKEMDPDSLVNILDKNPKLLSSLDDDCAIKILDTLASTFVITNEMKYLECLENICRVSDGYLAEQLVSEFSKFKQNALKIFLEHSYETKNNCLIKFFEYFLAQEIDDAVDPRLEFVEMRDEYKYELKKLGVSAEINNYFLSIINKYKPVNN